MYLSDVPYDFYLFNVNCQDVVPI